MNLIILYLLLPKIYAHVAYVNISANGLSISDVNSIHLNDDLDIYIKSNLLETFWQVTDTDALFLEHVPVYIAQDSGTSKTNTFMTEDFHYYRGSEDGCEITLKICISLHDFNIFAVCKNEVYDLHFQNAYHNNSLVFRIERIEPSKNEIHEFIREHDRVPIPVSRDKLHFKIDTRIRNRRSSVYPYDELYIELFLVVDNSLFKSFNSNVTTTYSKCMDLVNGVDSIYKSVNIRVALVGIEIWNKTNKIEITSNVNTVLEDFAQYSSSYLKEADNFHLLTAQSFDKVIGLAYVGSMCSMEWSAGLTRYIPTQHYSSAVATLAHEIGHNLKMEHDAENCKCVQQECVMYRSVAYPPPIYFSDCSMSSVEQFYLSGFGVCLENQPAMTHRVADSCGNNIVEHDEDCDCGSREFCTNPCCDPSICRLTKGSTCASGECCKNCQIATNITMCRHSNDRCDLNDFCDGVGTECRDIYVEDGVSCGVDGACHRGVCRSRNDQCERFWGSGAVSSNQLCYEKLNVMAKGYGHCGTSGNETYQECSNKDVMCGKLQCSNVSVHEPIIGNSYSHAEAIVIDGDQMYTCKSAAVDLGRQQPYDYGVVQDKTPCDDKKHCIDKKCVEVSYATSCTESCNDRERVCNNLASCICLNGWTGTNCNEVTVLPPPHKPIKPLSSSAGNKSLTIYTPLFICIFQKFIINDDF